MTGALVLALALQTAAPPQAAPRARIEVAPDTVRVGVPFILRITVDGVRGRHVAFPPLPDTGRIMLLAGPEITGGPGPDSRSAEYEVVAWEPGDLPVPARVVRVEADRGIIRLPLPERRVHVRSILPAEADPDTLPLHPARGVLGPNWSLAEKLGAAGALLAITIALLLGIRHLRRRRPVDRLIPDRPPRERALESLDALAGSGLLEIGELKAFYSELSRIVREFLSDSEPLWGLDLTTAELIVAAARDGVAEEDLAAVAELLVEADLVKFARRRPPAERARAALARGRGWVAGFERIDPDGPGGAEMAAVGAAPEG